MPPDLERRLREIIVEFWISTFARWRPIRRAVVRLDHDDVLARRAGKLAEVTAGPQLAVIECVAGPLMAPDHKHRRAWAVLPEVVMLRSSPNGPATVVIYRGGCGREFFVTEIWVRGLSGVAERIEPAPFRGHPDRRRPARGATSPRGRCSPAPGRACHVEASGSWHRWHIPGTTPRCATRSGRPEPSGAIGMLSPCPGISDRWRCTDRHARSRPPRCRLRHAGC